MAFYYLKSSYNFKLLKNMKTNANLKTVVQAVENVSANKYQGNVIFRKRPEWYGKNILRFTLKTKDKDQPGSLVNSYGMKQPKASKDVYNDVVREIFELQNSPNIFVEINPNERFFNENAPSLTEVEGSQSLSGSTEVTTDEPKSRKKRKRKTLQPASKKDRAPKKRGPGRPKGSKNKTSKGLKINSYTPNKFFKTLEFLLKNKDRILQNS